MGVYLPARLPARLPSAYQEVEYIESSGTQYINTGVKASNTISTELVMRPNMSYTSEYAIFGDAWSASALFLMEYQGRYRLHNGGNYGDFANVTDVKTTIETTPTGITINGVDYSLTAGSSYSNNNIRLFATGDGGNTSKRGRFKVYSFKIENNGTPVRDFVPCYRKSDNVIGMYDTVNDQFYTNSGTGAFSKGNDVTMSELKNAYIGEYHEGWQPGANTILYFSFNEDTATTVYDNSGHSYNGTRAGSNGAYSNLTVGKYTVFSGQTNQIINIPTSFTYPTTNYTFSFWIKYNTNSTGYAKGIFSKWNGNNGTGAYLLIQELQGKIRADIPYVAGDIFICDTALNDNTWHHIAMVKDGTSWYTYADKTLVKTNTGNYNVDGTNTTSGIIGKNQASYGQQFLGGLDEFIIEDKARTAQEISDYYNQTKGNYGL